jgi:hypothetical protein
VGQPESDFCPGNAGGYLWSPKRSKNGARNPFYEFMREVAPGDLVLSFEDNGRLLVSPVAHADSLWRMGITTDAAVNAGNFSEGQRRHLDYHREMVFLEARTH